jgi:predicted RND superfamily exporter protein
VSSLAWTIIAATIVLVVNFWFENRRPFLGVLTMIPVTLVVLWTFGLMYVSGIPFGPVTATLAALAVGIGVPYTIHLARRFEEDRNRFTDIEEAIRSTTRHTGGALAGSAFTTAAGFGILVTSTLTPFQQMGQVTAYAIVLSLAGSVLVLPSLLVLWERWHRRRDPATAKV